MSVLPTDILQRIKQLKMWQESHEELLKKSKNLSNTSANVTTVSDYQTIDGLSAFDSTTSDEISPGKPKNWDSQVISPTKTFHELLEEKLAQDPGPENVIPRPKKPFLKRGAGLQRFKMTPSRKPAKIIQKPSKSDTSVTPLRAPDLSIKPKASWSKIEDSGEHVRKINSLAQMDKSEAGEQTLYEKALEKELLIFEALEHKADNSSFCSTNSSVVRILSSTPSKIQPVITEEKRVHWESDSEEEVIETNLEQEDIAQILLRLKSLAGNRMKPNEPSPIDASDDEKWSSSASSVTSTDFEETLKIEKRDIGVGTMEQFSGNCPICGDQLQTKISEYEDKIKEVLQDKNRLNDHKKQLEQKERDFFKKKRAFEDEKQDLLYEIESEKKKLMKERQVFQMYMKDSQNRPNKKERQEISNLRQEVADLSETMKLKESKNGMTQARLRNQIKQAEKENSNLKDEVEKLTKENGRLSATRKLGRKSSADSKILQEINKNVTKLTQESLKSKKEEEEEEEKAIPKRKSLSDKDERSKIAEKPVQKRKSFPYIERDESVELDKEDSLLEMEINRNELEAQYESAFRNQSLQDERTLEDGSKLIKYPNGNVKSVSPDGNLITVKYFNGDRQETSLLDGTVKYYFFNKNICQTTFADGLEVVEFPGGVTEKRYPDGRCEVTLPDGVIQTTFPDGTQETKYTDGSTVNINKSGEKVLLLPNGQKEIETKDYKRREYPDGTIKILYPDGTQETKYANGRVRIKDSNGTLILDTQS